MMVYHGSTQEVTRPDVSFSREKLDFGRGFYVTPIKEQAVRWAMRWKARGGRAVLNVYVYAEENVTELGLKVKIYPEYNAEWLHFVMENRHGLKGHGVDVVVGGVANDRVFNTLELYADGLIQEEEALKRLKYEKPNQQICLCRQEVVDSLLSFVSSEEVSHGGE